jgi:hypothetical protein
MKTLLSYLLILISYCSYNQEKNGISIGLEGQLAFATDGRGIFTNFGGPGIKLKTKAFNLSFLMMPSLRFQNDDPKPFVIPVLGVGPQFNVLKNKRLILTFPAYYYVLEKRWTLAAGLGYVLTKPKQHN